VAFLNWLRCACGLPYDDRPSSRRRNVSGANLCQHRPYVNGAHIWAATDRPLATEAITLSASTPAPTPKAAYHHGALRSSLIAAARRLIGEHGEDRFSLADACAAAGVSTAAPYRHFADKDDLLDHVVAEGFTDLANRVREAAAQHAVGTETRILEVGRTYLAFGLAEPALFRKMFAQTPGRSTSELVNASGNACFATVLEEVAHYCQANAVDGDTDLVAVQLWTFVHGVTSLVGGGAYGDVAPGIDIDRLMTTAAEGLLFSLPRRP